MIRLTVFIIALLLAVEAIEPDPPWLITLAVLSGIEAFRLRSLGRGPRFRRRLRAWAGSWPGDEDW
ncbi:MAG: hypothetical protein IH958_04935 [Chloroflexi bacterium]|nr:hypothetical protein [Chloroflexota bacterium]